MFTDSLLSYGNFSSADILSIISVMYHLIFGSITFLQANSEVTFEHWDFQHNYTYDLSLAAPLLEKYIIFLEKMYLEGCGISGDFHCLNFTK